jgi:BCD family chlorophyll transporter-like MFS transporter
VALHYLVQLLRPRMGHGSDQGGRRTPWIIGGMGCWPLGGALAALATVWMGSQPRLGPGAGGAGLPADRPGRQRGGTSLLVLLAKRVAPERRAGAATVVWLMMIMGFAVTAGVTGRLLDPYSPARLLGVTAGVSALAWLVCRCSRCGAWKAGARARPSKPTPRRRSSATRWPRCGPTRRRAASPSSSSCRCWPTARRT